MALRNGCCQRLQGQGGRQVLFAFRTFPLAAAVPLGQQVIGTLSLSLGLLGLVSVVFESTEEAMQNIDVASSNRSRFPLTDGAPSELVWILKIFHTPKESTIIWI